MLAKVGQKAASKLVKSTAQPNGVVPALSRSLSSKSWVPDNDEVLQRVTMQSLIHEVSEQQRELASKVVPWFLKNMPVSGFVVSRVFLSLHFSLLGLLLPSSSTIH